MNDSTTRPWTDDEDYKLVAWGCAVGYGHVAQHDLGRTEAEGKNRIAWLREHRLEFVDRVIAEADSGF